MMLLVSIRELVRGKDVYLWETCEFCNSRYIEGYFADPGKESHGFMGVAHCGKCQIAVQNSCEVVDVALGKMW